MNKINRAKTLEDCPFCGGECKEDAAEIVSEGDAVIYDTIRCENCGVTFIMNGEDFNIREGK